jgi:hypothetical protein
MYFLKTRALVQYALESILTGLSININLPDIEAELGGQIEKSSGQNYIASPVVRLISTRLQVGADIQPGPFSLADY